MNKKKLEIVSRMIPLDVQTILDKEQMLHLKNNSFDMVIANQILEHLSNPEELIEEIKRVSKKYIIIGLPNELNWKARIKFLIGKPDWSGYTKHCHRHFFTVEKVEYFIKMFFGQYKEKRYWSASQHENKGTLRDNFPTLFCKEIYYLIEKNKCKKETIYNDEFEPIYEDSAYLENKRKLMMKNNYAKGQDSDYTEGEQE